MARFKDFTDRVPVGLSDVLISVIAEKKSHFSGRHGVNPVEFYRHGVGSVKQRVEDLLRLWLLATEWELD